MKYKEFIKKECINNKFYVGGYIGLILGAFLNYNWTIIITAPITWILLESIRYIYINKIKK